MKNTVVITDTAAADIADQFNYIRVDRKDMIYAERWLRELYAAIEGLEDFAGYARARESDFLDVELRQRVFKSHRIVFSVDEARHQVVVHYVRHSARRAVGEQPSDDE